MPTWLTNVFSLTHEISSKVALPIFITVCAILFLPTTYANILAIDQFRDAYRIWLGVILILTFSALVSNALWLIGRLLKPWIKQAIFIRQQSSHLRNLTEDEKDILRRFIIDREASVGAPISSGPMGLLVQKSVVFRASNVAAHYTTFMYVMQPWARDFLEKHPRLLD